MCAYVYMHMYVGLCACIYHKSFPLRSRVVLPRNALSRPRHTQHFEELRGEGEEAVAGGFWLGDRLGVSWQREFLVIPKILG